MKYPLLVSLVMMVGAVNGQDSPDARAILDKVAQASKTGRSYRAEFVGSLENTGTSLQQKVGLTGGTVTFQQPDRVRLEVKMGPVETLMVRDGVETWIYLPATKQYRKFTATPANGPSPDLSMLFGDVTANVSSARPVADEDITFGGSPTRCYVILTESNLGERAPSVSVSPVKSTLWIDQMNYMVVRRRSTWTTQAPQLQTPIESTMEFALTKLTWSPTLTGAEFTFAPPAGATDMANRQAASGAPPQSKPPGPERASITVESVPMYSKMSTTSPVIAVLHKDDAVTVDFSVGGSNGGWCSVTQAVEGGKSGNVPCNSLEREPVAQLDSPSPTRAPASAPVGLTLPITRASRIPRAPLNIRVYFVPIGSLAYVDVQYLVRYYQLRFGLTITALPAIALDNSTFNPNRRQNQAEGLIQSIQTGYPALANNGRSILIGITEADIYTPKENWIFALGLRDQERLAVVSSARMDLDHINLGAPSDLVGLHSRLTKMISRDIGIMYYRLPISANRRSVVRSSIMGVDELDELGEDF